MNRRTKEDEDSEEEEAEDRGEQDEEYGEEEEEDEDWEVPQCDFNPICRRQQKKKIDGNGVAVSKPSAGIKGGGQMRAGDVAIPQCTALCLFMLTTKFTTNAPTMHCFPAPLPTNS